MIKKEVKYLLIIDSMELKNQSHLKHKIVDKLSENVIWQLPAKIALARAIEDITNPLCNHNWPLYKALYYWPSWSWKTQMAKALSNLLFDDEYWYTHISWETMQHWHEIAKLFGSPPWYIGYWQPPILSERNIYRSYDAAMKRWKLLEDINWYWKTAVILFDEIEKAHPSVYKSLMAILDEWIVQLNNWSMTDLRNAFILMTSNIWEKEISNSRKLIWFGEQEDNENKLSIRQKAITSFFSPEFIGRIDDMFEFEKIVWVWLSLILDKFINQLKDDIEYNYMGEIEIEVEESARHNIITNAWDNIRFMQRYFDHNIRHRLWKIIETNYIDRWKIKIRYDKWFIFDLV